YLSPEAAQRAEHRLAGGLGFIAVLVRNRQRVGGGQGGSVVVPGGEVSRRAAVRLGGTGIAGATRTAPGWPGRGPRDRSRLRATGPRGGIRREGREAGGVSGCGGGFPGLVRAGRLLLQRVVCGLAGQPFLFVCLHHQRSRAGILVAVPACEVVRE